MARANAATVRRPGANAATETPDPSEAGNPASISGVEAAARSNTVDGDTIDPTKLTQPKFDPEQGWICPAPKTSAERTGSL
ncbi:MAG TPA: hypothetical protein VGE88_07065 [Lysobacter sp.]